MIVRIHFRFLIFFILQIGGFIVINIKSLLHVFKFSICQSQQLGKKIHLGKFEKEKKETPV